MYHEPVLPNKNLCYEGPSGIECQEEKEFLSYFRESEIPHPDDWTEKSSLFVTGSRRAKYINYEIPGQCHEEQAPIPLDGSVIPFFGPLFRGKIVSRVRDVPINVADKDPTMSTSVGYFKGRSRQYQWTVQGVFSKRIRFDELVTGQDFGRPFRNTPPSVLLEKGIKLLRNRLPETFEWCVY